MSPSAITALIARREVARAVADGADAADVAVVHNVISSAQVAEVIAATGARAVRTRVGHSFIKAEMARHDAVFGGEHSAHYYFRDFWFADTGMLAAMHTLAALGEQPEPLSTVMADLARYSASGEINSTVADAPAATEKVRAWAAPQGVDTDELDGLTLTHAGRRHRRRPDVVAQPARLQHRAAAPPQRRGRRRRHHGSGSATRCSPSCAPDPRWPHPNPAGCRPAPAAGRAHPRGRATHPPCGRIATTPSPRPGREPMSEQATPASPIEPWLREILRCPACRSELRDETADSGPELVCTNASCGLAYRIDDGVPVLLVDEARRPA